MALREGKRTDGMLRLWSKEGRVMFDPLNFSRELLNKLAMWKYQELEFAIRKRKEEQIKRRTFARLREHHLTMTIGNVEEMMAEMEGQIRSIEVDPEEIIRRLR